MPTVNMAFDLVNRLEDLDRLNLNLDLFRSRAGLDSRCFGEVCLALEELFTNIVRHGHKDAGPHRISFSLSLDSGTLTICIQDDGIPFDPNAVPQPDLKCSLEQRKIGGLGVYLIKKVMDEIIYVRCDDKNMTTLKKWIDDPSCMEG